jgi:hypothetical protein
MSRGLWWGYLKEGHQLEEQGVDGLIILKLILKEYGGKA